MKFATMKLSAFLLSNTGSVSSKDGTKKGAINRSPTVKLLIKIIVVGFAENEVDFLKNF